jgi:hypothetical protein
VLEDMGGMESTSAILMIEIILVIEDLIAIVIINKRDALRCGQRLL